MEATTLAVSIMPVNTQQVTVNSGAKGNSKAVKGVFADLLHAIQGSAPTETQGSPGTTTDSTDKTGKDAASNSLLQALIQLLSGQSQSSPNMAQSADDSGGSGSSGTVSASLSSLINQIIDSLQASGSGQVDKGLLADLTGLSQALQGDQAGAAKTDSASTGGGADGDSQAANLLAAVKTALSQAADVLNDNASAGSVTNAVSAGVLPRAPDGATTTVSLSSQAVAKTGANLPSPGPDVKDSSAPTATQGTVDSTTLAKTVQTAGAQSITGRYKETLARTLETQQPQEPSPQSSSGSEEVSSLLAQSSVQQSDLSSATGLGQTTNATSSTLGDSVFNQIVASASLAVNNNNASMSIQLKPEFLGDLKLVVGVEQGVLNAHFITQNQVTASLIEARLPELKQALNDQGISWQHLTVSSEASQGNHQGASSQSQQNTNPSQSQSDYGYEVSSDSDMAPTMPMVYQWAGTGTINYVV